MEISEVSATPRAVVRRRVVAGLLAVAALALLLLSPALGRADPVGSYRPPLPADALVNGCWSLPGDVRLPFAYQVRRDALVSTPSGERRRLVLHYDEMSGARAARAARAAFAEAGVRDVVVRVLDFELGPEAVVRGQMTLDLPPSQPERRSACRDPYSTKQFAPPLGSQA